MRAVHLVRPIVAASVAAASACSLWAALDDPYKSDPAALVDAGNEAAAASHVIDAGGAPYAVTAYGDNVYVVDDHAKVHVAVEAGTTFTTFWAGGTSDVVGPTNRIAASSAGVFWSIVGGIRYCPLDGGACGLLPRGGTPTLIAAGDSVVAWKEAGDAGIGRCDVPLSQCTPTSIPTEAPTSIAVEPDGTIAFASGRAVIGFVSGSGPRTFLPVKGYAIEYVATDTASGALYWIGPTGVGAVPFDAGTVPAPTPLDNGPPSQLFALDGVAYWSVPTQPATAIDYCRFADGGCPHSSAVGTVAANNRTDQGIAATSRDVFTILAALSGNPQLYVWGAPQ
jgi:hypothetical protein